MVTFVRTGITWSAVKRSPPDSNIEWLVTEVQETTIANVYKPPPSELYPTSLPSLPAPAIYAGDFNCQHTDWGYKQTTKDGETLSDWASTAEAVLLYDPKEHPSFFSARWNTYTNPDLAFAVYLGSQTSFGVTACCKRYVGKNRIYIHLGTKCAWTTLTDFCWKFVGTIWTAWPTRGDNRRINMLRTSTKPKKNWYGRFLKDFGSICHVN